MAKPTILAQLIVDKLPPHLSLSYDELVEIVDSALKIRDRIAGERSKHTRGMAPVITRGQSYNSNWGRRNG